MCVIMIAKETRPTEEMIQKGWDRNDHGGGIAWRELDKEGKTVVRWKKGIETVEEMYQLMMDVPMPYVAHFRIASSGGKGFQFTHPFPVEPNVSMSMGGTTSGYVLFHNGDWKGYEEYMLKTAAGFGVRIPRGKFNDTRAMAWLTYVIGEGFMEVLPSQRGVLFGPRDYEVYVGPGWSKINDVWCSNDYFWERKKLEPVNHNRGTHSPIDLKPWCIFGQCNRKDLVEGTKFCPAHTPAARALQGTSEVAHPAPFRQGGQPPRSIIGVELASKLCPKKGEGVRRISKNEFKRILDCHERIASKDQKRSNKGMQDLITISERVLREVFPGMTGSGQLG